MGACCVSTAGNSCGSCGGTLNCDGVTCSVATPVNYGAICNACGGTIQCDGVTCSPACPPTTTTTTSATTTTTDAATTTTSATTTTTGAATTTTDATTTTTSATTTTTGSGPTTTTSATTTTTLGGPTTTTTTLLACNPTIFKSGSVSPLGVNPGNPFTITCDYGVANAACISVSGGVGPCAFAGFGGPDGTVGTFNCLALATYGTFTPTCTAISAGACGTTFCTTLTSPITPPITDFQPCTGGGICGSISDLETGSVPLGGVPVELRAGNGSFISSVKTSLSNGTYSFGSLTNGNAYIVSPIANRTQSASPQHISIAYLPAGGATVSAQVRGAPANITIQGTPGTFVLLAPGAPYPGGTLYISPPPIQPGSSNYYSAVVGTNGTVQIQVAGGTGANYAYYLTCWTPKNTAGTFTYNRTPTTGQLITTAHAANAAEPNDTIPAGTSTTCPSY